MTLRDLDFFISDDPPVPSYSTVQVQEVRAKVALSPSSLPGLDYALNPYIGCEHGCLYCFAPEVVHRDGATWAKKVTVRSNIPNLLAKELKSKGGSIGIGTVTDPYQPLEAVCLLTRKCLLEIAHHKNRISILTKSDLLVRDSELIINCNAPEVGITINSLDEEVCARLEPGAVSPGRRIKALRHFAPLVETYAMVGPLFPFLKEPEVIALVDDIAETGTKRVMLDRLRLRPGVLTNLQRYQEDPLVAQLLSGMVQKRSDLVETWLRDRCHERGLRVENAF